MTRIALCSPAIINMQQPVAEPPLGRAVIARRDGSWRRAMAAGGGAMAAGGGAMAAGGGAMATGGGANAAGGAATGLCTCPSAR